MTGGITRENGDPIDGKRRALTSRTSASAHASRGALVLRALVRLLVALTILAPMAPRSLAADPSARGVNDDRKWALSLMAGYASIDADMQFAPKAWWNKSFREESVIVGAASYNVVRFLRHFTFEAEVGLGHRFGVGANDVWVAGFIRYDNFPWHHILRTTIAGSIGVNYIDELPMSERGAGKPTSHLLHYFAPEITFALPDRPEHELVMRIHHRSGIFGLINGVHGASDAFVMGYRYRF